MWSIKAYGNYRVTDETLYYDHTMAFWVKTQCHWTVGGMQHGC